MKGIVFLKDDDVLTYYANQQINTFGFIMPQAKNIEVSAPEGTKLKDAIVLFDGIISLLNQK